MADRLLRGHIHRLLRKPFQGVNKRFGVLIDGSYGIPAISPECRQPRVHHRKAGTKTEKCPAFVWGYLFGLTIPEIEVDFTRARRITVKVEHALLSPFLRSTQIDMGV